MEECGHKIINTNCKNCRSIQNKWYQKLEKTKFEDAESLSYGDDRPLKSWHSFAFQKISPIEFEIVHEYNDRCRDLLHKFEFESTVQRKIWELYCEGMSRYKIEVTIKHFKDAPKQSTIRKIIMDLERELKW